MSEMTADQRHKLEVQRIHEERQRARLYVAGKSLDADDCRMLLDVLGLDEVP